MASDRTLYHVVPTPAAMAGVQGAGLGRRSADAGTEAPLSVLFCRVPATRRPPTKVSPATALKPLVAPVLTRLDKHERLLEELRDALDIQFKRTAAIQAQLDQLLAKLK